ncbi:hypothetical protein CXB49_09305 [Chromobacterium sp. ATCC 53434]|uniref:hypothetical protein n=1 Tax=Chromobacterium TaxID=535 RepID=UPI000C75E33F|nr:hypothetical protein [Chromobacterium sp. ATCC 53434]AUH50993.1 hypothetical protein CXB49_09305 [Chromobacterium sp. ATCC 53434]
MIWYFSIRRDAVIPKRSPQPETRLLSISGYYDFDVPLYSAVLSLQDPSLDQKRVRTTVFEGGHMTYQTEASRPKIRDALIKILRRGRA